MNDPDRALVNRAQRGDKSAMGEIVNRYYEMVYVVCYGVLREREAARDTAQEVFLKISADIGKFTGQSKFKTWLYRVATNAAIDQTRRRRPSVSLDATDSTEEDHAPVVIPARDASPRAEAEKGELRETVKQALESLSPEHRAVLILREWQELSYEEIAEALGIELGTVMSRIFYARKKLGEVLRGMGIGSEKR